MKLAETFAHAVARKLGYLVVTVLLALLAGLFSVGEAKAHSSNYVNACPQVTPRVCHQGIAFEKMTGLPQSEMESHCIGYSGNTPNGYQVEARSPSHNTSTKSYSVQIWCKPNPSGSSSGGNFYQGGAAHAWYYGDTCANVSNDPAISTFSINATLNPTLTICSAGCVRTISAADVSDSWQITSTAGGDTVGFWKRGPAKVTGATCTADDFSPPPPEPLNLCTTFGDVTTCRRSDGKDCITASGSTFCYGPSETGPKANTSRDSAADKPPPNNQPHGPNNREGEDWQPGQTTTTTHTTGGVSTSVSITQYINGSPNPNGESVNGDGSSNGVGQQETGGSGNGDGDGDGDDNSASGGVGCQESDRPVVSGDPLLGAVVIQTWHTRCEVVKSRGKIEGDASCNDGAPIGFACSGDEAVCFQALKAQEEKCRADKEAADRQAWKEGVEGMAGDDDGLGDVDIEDAFETGAGDINIEEGLLGQSGGTCGFGVPLELMGEPIELPQGFWTLADWIGTLVVALAYIWVAGKLTS